MVHIFFAEPYGDCWKLGNQFQSLWQLFLPVKLTYNHRQEDEAEFAEMLKRNARVLVTDDDFERLKCRVFPEKDPHIPRDTLYVFPTRKLVKEYNEKQLNLLEGECEVLTATNILSTKKHFESSVDPVDGKVKNTSLLNKLYLKKGCNIVLTYNVDVCDGLSNGAKGTVLDFIRDENTITHVVVQFENKDAGKALRESFKDKNILNAYENGTPISRISFSYNLSRKQLQEGQKAICIQFPLQLGFAMTIQKVQGATVSPPKTITTDFSAIFGGSQAYTVLSRIKQPDQLFLINDVYIHKIYTCKKSLKALKELESKAINNNSIGRWEERIKICCLNIKNLIHHIEDVKHHHKIREHELILLSETWISDRHTSNVSNPYQIPNYTSHYNNIGNGKGLASF